MRMDRKKTPGREAMEEKTFPKPGRTPREDTASVMEFYGIETEFPAKALEEARIAAARPIKAAGRLDLRKKMVFTCDPATARDYDDALSIEKGRGGRRILGVHIADVSEYVKEGGALDREAFKRSTSVYFADRVVPMLPEILSNGVCSLVPGEDRYAFSVFMEFDKNGKMTGRKFAKSIIRSGMRFTYEQVMGMIASGPKSGKWAETVCEIHELAARLRSLRFASGALDLEIPEQEVVLDGNGEMAGIVSRRYDESHQMVEECMVAANEAVAAELWTKGIKILARLHEPPDPDKVEELRAQAKELGVKVGDISKRAALAHFLETVKKHPLAPLLSVMTLRSMKRAVYDSRDIGHYGLAKRFYAHFTSPIRRYPDLVLHRQLAAHVLGEDARLPARTLSKYAKHTTAMEERAAEAERSLLEIKKYRLLADELASRMPVDYDAAISKVAPFGFFVDLPELAVSGLVHVSTLSRGYVRYDAGSGRLVARGGTAWKTGDRIKVRVARVDFERRRIDFIPSKTLN